MVGRALMIALTIATARALQPSDVGVLGLATIVVGVLAMLAVYGEMAAVVSAERDDHLEYALTAFLLRTATTALVVLVASALQPVLVGWLTHESGQARNLEKLLHILFLQLAAETVGAYPRVWLQRRLALATVSAVNLLAMAVHVGASIGLLWAGFGTIGIAWSYVGASSLASLAFWLAMFSRGGGMPSGWPAAASWRDVWRNTLKLAAGGFVGYFNCRVDNLLVSGVLGPAAMSFYGMAWNAARTPASIIGRSASFVLVPTVARVQEDRRAVERGLRDGLWYSYALLAPLCAGMYLVAPQLVEVVLGAKWLPVVPILRIMCVTVLATPLLEISNSLLVALGRGHLSGIATSAQLLTIIVAIPMLSRRWGLTGAAYADLVSAAIDTVVLCATARFAVPEIRWLGVSAIVGPILAALAAALSAAVSALWLTNLAFGWLIEVGVFIGLYPICLWMATGRDRFRESTALLRRALGLEWTLAPTR